MPDIDIGKLTRLEFLKFSEVDNIGNLAMIGDRRDYEFGIDHP
jgi:hypothetical protein